MSVRPKFRIWDNELNQWYQPTYRAYAGELHDLMINLDGSLALWTTGGLAHESLFPGRYELICDMPPAKDVRHDG